PRPLQIELARRVQEVADTTGREITAAEIHALFRRTYVDLVRPYRYVGHAIRNEGKVVHVEVEGEIDGQRRKVAGTGNGPADALVGALGLDLRVRDYHEHALGRGAQAEAVAYVEVRRGGGPSVHGVGIDANLVAASLRAVVAATNRAVSAETPKRHEIEAEAA